MLQTCSVLNMYNVFDTKVTARRQLSHINKKKMLHEITCHLVDTETGEVLYVSEIPNFSPNSPAANSYLSRWLGCFLRSIGQGRTLSFELSNKITSF